MEKSTNIGMQTFDQALYELYRAGKITLDEAIKNADSANNLRLRVKLSEEDGGVEDRKKLKNSAKEGKNGTDKGDAVSDEGEIKLHVDL
jgi:twitching motility protein PilU